MDLELLLETAARQMNMTTEQLVEYLTFGERRHPDAPPQVCGSISPAYPALWCGLAPHPGEGFHLPSEESVMAYVNDPGRPAPPSISDVLLGVGVPTPHTFARRHPLAAQDVCAHPDPDHPDQWCVKAPDADHDHLYGRSA